MSKKERMEYRGIKTNQLNSLERILKMIQILSYLNNKTFYLYFLSERQIELPLPYQQYNYELSLTI